MKIFYLLILSSWLVSATTVSLAQSNQVPDNVEFQALKDLWDGTAGSTWTNRTNWPVSGSWPSSATATQMDAWYGIVVTNGDITELQLSGNNLTGTLPSSLANLTQLKIININGGKLNGSIPTWLGTMTQLTFLRLDNNLFTGAIPTQLANLTALQTLGLAFNIGLTGDFPDFSTLTAMKGFSFAGLSNLTPGPIPSWIFSMPNLEAINFNTTKRNGTIPDLNVLTHLNSVGLQSNSLTGSFPVSLTQCSNIVTLDLGSNQLSGDLPPQIGNMTALTTLSLSFNKFTGTVPDEINNIHGVQYLSINSNLLTGFPTDITGLTSIIFIDISTNQIAGSLPVFPNSLSTLTEIRFNSNKFFGPIPTAYANFPNLIRLALDGNKLTGPIPTVLGSMNKLFYLILSNNQLTGSIPTELGNMSMLVALYLSNNQLTGTLPSSLGNLSRLMSLTVDGNKLSGNVPPIFATLTAMNALQLNNNRFTGTLPTLKGAIINVSNNLFTGAFPAWNGGYSLSSIYASNNGFTSITSIPNVSTLSIVDFTNNELTALPSSLLTHPNKANIKLLVGNNRLDFSTLEPYASGFLTGSTVVPQKTINDLPTVALTVGSSLVLTARPLGTNTSITWERQSYTGSWSTVTDNDGVASTYTKNPATKDDVANYRWKTTSSTTGLTATTIQSDPIIVKTQMAFVLDNWAFAYKYDTRHRMTHKKVPGADTVYMVYDDRDRLVMTQDGLQRQSNQWTYTKYDVLNRPIMTGLYTDTVRVNQQAMATRIDKSLFYETYDATSSVNYGYSNTVMPTSRFHGSFEPLTITYYDSYDFLHNGAYFAYKTGELANQYLYTTGAAFPKVTGLITGTWTRILGKDRQWLRQVSYYDDKGRVVQMIADNHKRGQDITTTNYDFIGKPTATKTRTIDHRLTWVKEHPYVWLAEDRLTGSANFLLHAYTNPIITADGWVEFTVSADNGSATNGWFGLSTSQQNAVGYSVLQNKTSASAKTTVQVSESGVLKGSALTAAGGDVIRIERQGSTINYSKNGVVFYTTTGAVTTALLAHAAMNVANTEIYNPRTSVQGPIRTTERKFEYDHAGRLTKTWHSIDGASMVVLSQQSYNELGQLLDKKLYSTDGTNFHQSIDYRYNIRGWLTSINGAELGQNDKNTDAAGDRKDLFGMDLLYNETNGGLSNSGLYNGNISAMRWSNNLGLSATKEKAYTFTYDPMNRLTDATQRTYSTLWTASPNFHEKELTYDLNGNIQSLTRTDAEGANVDKLEYKYGDNNMQSNRLLKVTDYGSSTVSFVDPTSQDTDYTYDVNGNLTSDKNKGITGISYNHLNLPTKVTKSTNEYVTYTYDATGKKLIQDLCAANGSLTKRTDYRGEWFYEKDTLRFVNHEEGRAVTEGAWSPAPQLWPDPDVTNSAFYGVYYNANATTLSMVTMGDQNYLKVVSNQSSGATGNNSITLDLVPGRKYTVKVKGYNASANAVVISIGGTGNLGSGTIATSSPIPTGAANEGWTILNFTVPTSMRAVGVGAVWKTTVAVGDTYYINKIELYEYHDAHGNEVFTQTGQTYEYNLKDHLGNVRMTFTTKDETESATATLENDHISEDRANFLNYDDARLVYSQLFNHANDGSPGYAQRMSGGPNEKIGLAKSLSVMPGDVINTEVYAKYFYRNDPNLAGVWQTLLGYFANPAASGGQVIDGTSYSTASNLTVPWTSGYSDTPDENVPQAFLHYMFINREYDLASLRYKTKQISVNAREDGTDTQHEQLFITDNITEPGYVYIYLSNDEEQEAEVYFDDFKVEHVKGPVIQTQDYYPFGLTYGSYSRENSLANQYQYNGKEMQDELNLGWLDYGLRSYQADLGRWAGIDPLADKYANIAPYAYVANNPVALIDPNGAEIWLSFTWKDGNGDEQTSRLQYKGKTLYTEDGKKYENGSDPMDPILQLVKYHLDFIQDETKGKEGGEEVAQIFSDLESDDDEHNIIIGLGQHLPNKKPGHESNDQENVERAWSWGSGTDTYYFPNNYYDPDQKEPFIYPVIALLHELQHAHDTVKGIRKGPMTSTWVENEVTHQKSQIDNTEFRAVDTENILRHAFNLPKRTSWAGYPLPDKFNKHYFQPGD